MRPTPAQGDRSSPSPRRTLRVLAIAGRAEARTSIDEHPQRSNPDARASSWSGHAVEGALILERSLDVVKGASIPISGVTSRFPSRLVRPARNPTSLEDLATPGVSGHGTSREIADPCGLLCGPPHDAAVHSTHSEIRHRFSVSPEGIHETGVWPRRQSGCPIVAASRIESWFLCPSGHRAPMTPGCFPGRRHPPLLLRSPAALQPVPASETASDLQVGVGTATMFG